MKAEGVRHERKPFGLVLSLGLYLERSWTFRYCETFNESIVHPWFLPYNLHHAVSMGTGAYSSANTGMMLNIWRQFVLQYCLYNHRSYCCLSLFTTLRHRRLLYSWYGWNQLYTLLLMVVNWLMVPLVWQVSFPCWPNLSLSLSLQFHTQLAFSNWTSQSLFDEIAAESMVKHVTKMRVLSLLLRISAIAGLYVS